MTTSAQQLEAVWDLLGGPIRFFAKSNQLVEGGRCDTLASFTRTANNLRNWDFYVTLNPSTFSRRIKASSADITHWRRILIDIDPVTKEAKEDPHEALLAGGMVASHISEIIPGSLKALSVISSGRGCQMWLEIEPTKIESNEHRQRIERATSHFLRLIDTHECGCRVDPSCSDLSRVARCPGTTNQKNGGLAYFIYPTVGLTPIPAEAILSLAPNEPIVEHESPQSFTGLAQMLPHIGQRPATFLTEGVSTPGRHSAAYAASASLRELGIPESQAVALVIAGGSYCRPILRPLEISRIVAKAYEKEQL